MEDNEQVAEVLDRRSALSAAFDEIEETQAQPEVAPKADKPRDEGGKFVEKQAVKAGKSTPEPVVEAAPVEEPLWKRPPASWKKDTHDVWATAAPRMQELAYQREEQMRQGVEPLLPKAKFADEVNFALEPYLPTIRGLGIEPVAAIKGLMDADYKLRSLPHDQKLAFLGQIAASYGINLGQAMQNGGIPQPQVQDPNLFAVQNQFNQLRGELEGFKAQQTAAENARIQLEINEFSRGKEYFEEVRPVMVQLLQSGTANTLDEAYKKAIRLNDEIFEAEQQRTQSAANASKIASSDKAAKAAKAAAVSVKSSTPGSKTPTKAQDRRSMLVELFDQQDGRL